MFLKKMRKKPNQQRKAFLSNISPGAVTELLLSQ